MIDERTRALINESLDQSLTPADREELDQILENSAEAREYRESMTQIGSLLEDSPAVPFPEDLHQKIIDQITLPQPASSSWWSGLRELPGFVRYGFATAAGLVIAIGLYEIRPELIDSPNGGDVMGTMVPKRIGQVSVIDSFSFEQSRLTSSAALERRENELVLDLKIDAEDALEVNIQLLGTGFRFQALAQTQTSFESFEFGDRSIRAIAQGRQEFSVLLDPTGESVSGARIRLEYSSSGGLIEERELVPDQ